jgi:DNA-binding response OmpR family regulator
MIEGPRVLLISDDDDMAGPLVAILRRAGYRVEARDARLGYEELEGEPPDALILDRDLPSSGYRKILERLERQPGADSYPLLILGGGGDPSLPRGWHEDAARSVGRPPVPGEVLATLEGLRRLAFYRPYRDLVHSLSQPVMTLHALSRTIGRAAGSQQAPDRETIDRLMHEAERLMSLMEEFQRSRRAASG